jgi:perosamine synthetase
MTELARIAQMEPWYGPEEKAEIDRCLDEGGWLTEYTRTAAFERALEAYTGAAHAVVVNNGTISLTLAAIALGIGPGDEVIVPNYTMIASPNSVRMIGAVPVFVDVEPETLCLDLALVERAITPRTKAVMLVTANGRSPARGIAAFERLCAARGLALIEDAAQSLGSRYPDGRHQGTVGAIGSLSFSTQKIISTGQGGALLTNSDALGAALRRLKDFGRSGGGNDVHASIGFNAKFTELQGCLGVAQMTKLAWRVERKKAILRGYRSGLAGCAGIRLFEQDLAYGTPWFIDAMAEERDALREWLTTRGIGTRLMYGPINAQQAYRLPGSYPVSERVGAQGVWLPSASQLTDAQIDRVCEAIGAFYAR